MGIDFFAIFATPRRRSKKLERPADEEECEKWRPPMDPVRRRQHDQHLAEESLLFFLFFFLPSFTEFHGLAFESFCRMAAELGWFILRFFFAKMPWFHSEPTSVALRSALGPYFYPWLPDQQLFDWAPTHEKPISDPMRVKDQS